MIKIIFFVIALLISSCVFAKEYSILLTKVIENYNDVYTIKWTDDNNCDSYNVIMVELYYNKGKFIDNKPSFVEEVKETQIDIPINKLTPGGDYYLRVIGKKGNKEFNVYEKHILLISHININIPKSLIYDLEGQEKDFNDIVNFNQAMFSTPSSEYNRDIALFSSVASACAYYEDEKNLKGKIEDFFNNMGFKDPKYYNAEELVRKKEDSDKVLFAIANRKVNVKNKTYNVISVVIRGTVAGEWYSNFNIGNGEFHEGFKIAADDVKVKLEAYLNEYNLTNPNLNIIIVTGHSRGAAVANILSATLLNKPYVKKDKLYVYGFATPNVTKNIDVDTNCINILNVGDCVPIIPFWEDWKRYGKEIRTDEISQEQMKEIAKTFKEITKVNYEWYTKKELDNIKKELLRLSPDEYDFYHKKYNISAKDCGKTTYEVCNILSEVATTGDSKDWNRIPNEFNSLFLTLAFSNMGSPKIMNVHAMEFYINFIKQYNKTIKDKTYDFYTQ